MNYRNIKGITRPKSALENKPKKMRKKTEKMKKKPQIRDDKIISWRKT